MDSLVVGWEALVDWLACGMLLSVVSFTRLRAGRRKRLEDRRNESVPGREPRGLQCSRRVFGSVLVRCRLLGNGIHGIAATAPHRRHPILPPRMGSVLSTNWVLSP